jgi:N-acetylneuraminic acid mutarotase
LNKKAYAALVAFIIAAFCSLLCLYQAFASLSDSWTTKTTLPFSVGPYSGQAGVLDGKIYTVRGSPTRMEVYDPSSDSWTEKSELPLHNNLGSTGFIALAACGNKIYVIGGLDLFASEVYIIYGENEVYDTASDSWSYMKQIPTTVAWYASSVVDDKIYIIGGFQSHQNPDGSKSVKFTNLVQIFNPKTNQWTQGASMPTNMAKLAGCATTGLMALKRIYVVGGIIKDETQTVSTYPEVSWTQIYDPETNNWLMGISLPAPRSSISLVNINDRLYALGGSESTTNQEYTPADYGLVRSSTAPDTTPSPSVTYSSENPSPSIPEYPTLIVTSLIVGTTIISIALRKRRKPFHLISV